VSSVYIILMSACLVSCLSCLPACLILPACLFMWCLSLLSVFLPHDVTEIIYILTYLFNVQLETGFLIHTS
jgi:hypothetical protein